MAILTVNPASVTEGTDGDEHIAYFQVNLSAPATQDVSFQYKTSSEGLKAPANPTSDFELIEDGSSDTIVIPKGQVSTFVPVSVYGNSSADGNRSFALTLYNINGAALKKLTDTSISAVGTIKDDEPLVTIAPAKAIEGSPDEDPHQMYFPVSLSAPAGQDVVIAYHTELAGSGKGFAEELDFTMETSGLLTIPAGSISDYIPIDITGDGLPESNETFNIVIDSISGAGITKGKLNTDGKSYIVGTIIDDDSASVTPTSQVSVSPSKMMEPVNGKSSMVFTVLLSAPAPDDIHISWKTQDLKAGTSAALAGKDYLASSGTLVIPHGKTMAQISVPVYADNAIEPDESFSLVLFNPDGVGLGSATGANMVINGTIIDHPKPTITAFAASAVEGGKKDHNILPFTVLLSEPSEKAVTFNYSIDTKIKAAPGIATAGKDFVTSNGTIKFAPGETAAHINIKLIGDSLPEGNENFNVKISNANGAVLAANQSDGTLVIVGTIIDDEPIAFG